MTSALCVLCGTRPPRLRKLACEPCGDELYRLLAELDELVPQLRGLVQPGVTAGRSGARSSSTSGTPLNLGALALLADTGDLSITAVLGRYGAGATPGELRARVDHIVAQAWLTLFADDLRRLHRDACKVCGQNVKRRALCSRTVDEDTGRECGGDIIVIEGNKEAKCTRCGDIWPRDMWRFLGRLQQP